MDLESWFEEIDEKDLQNLVDDREQEDLHLEFKTVKSATLTDRNDKKNFAKALSGFSNANGGLVVWGVYATTNEEGVDCAVEPRHIDKVSVLHSRLETHTGQWVDPQVPGVRHKVVFTDESKDQGCVVSFIPESEAGPHMSVYDNVYYTRSGSSFYAMNHSQVADRFFRKRIPRLKLYTSFSRIQAGNVYGTELIDFELIVGIENFGKGIAKYPFLSMRVPKPYGVSSGGLDGNRHDGMPRLPRGNHLDPLRWGAGVDTVVHPGAILQVAKVVTPQPGDYQWVGKDIVIEYEIGAEDAVTVKDTKTVRYSEMEMMVQKKQDQSP